MSLQSPHSPPPLVCGWSSFESLASDWSVFESLASDWLFPAAVAREEGLESFGEAQAPFCRGAQTEAATGGSQDQHRGQPYAPVVPPQSAPLRAVSDSA